MKKKHWLLALVFFCLSVCFLTLDANAAAKLSAPKITLSSVASTGKIKITWKEIKGADSYQVYRSTNEGKTWKRIATTKKTSFTNTGAVAAKKYYYKVRATANNAKVKSSFSAVKSRVCDLARPTVTVSTVLRTGKIKVSWKKVDKAVSYDVYRSANGGKTWSKIKNTKNTYLTNTSVSTGKTYQYKVKAISSRTAANSAYSLVKKLKCGYISGEKKLTRYIAKPWVSIYEFPDSDSDRISLPYMAKVQLGKAVSTGSSGKWYRLYYQNKLYYVWIVTGDGKLTTKKSSFEYEASTEYCQSVLDLAVDIAQDWKTAYRHGESKGVADENGVYGFDCSGFVSYVINTVMQKEVPTFRLSASVKTLYATDSVYNEGFANEFQVIDVKKTAMQPGDVLFFSLKSDLDHCGIYLGNNEFVHSSYYWDDDSVCIMPLKDSYKEDLTEVRRYIPTKTAPANEKRYVTKVCKMYKEKTSESEVVYQFSKGETVTVLYTDNNNYALVENEDGLVAYMLLRNLSKTE